MGGKKDKSKGGKKEIKRKKGKERESYDYTSKEYQNFVDRLRNEGLGVFRVDADGNCLFRSLSHQLWGEESLHHRCRQEIMNYIPKSSFPVNSKDWRPIVLLHVVFKWYPAAC